MVVVVVESDGFVHSKPEILNKDLHASSKDEQGMIIANQRLTIRRAENIAKYKQ